MRLSRWRVRAGYVAGPLVLLLARPTTRSLLAGAVLALAGEAVRVWASGHLEKTRELATGGPYAHTRNPLYFGSLLMALGVALAGASPWALVVVAVYFAVFYPSVMREEARFLAARFEELYREWAREVPLFVPRLRPAGPRATGFAWERVRRNREWQAALALPLVALLLWARSALW